MRSVFGVSLAFVALLIAVLHSIAHQYFLYWEWWWFDIIMHILGGILIAGFVLWLIRYEVPPLMRKYISPFLSAFSIVLLIGGAWEMFELFTGMYLEYGYSLDTFLDMCANTVGALIAYFIFLRYVSS